MSDTFIIILQLSSDYRLYHHQAKDTASSIISDILIVRMLEKREKTISQLMTYLSKTFLLSRHQYMQNNIDRLSFSVRRSSVSRMYPLYLCQKMFLSITCNWKLQCFPEVHSGHYLFHLLCEILIWILIL